MVWQNKRKQQWLVWALLILTTAVFLRFYQLTTVPPGLTHDEADHGLSAWGVVQGQRPIYFTVGYGREPLYDYAVAAIMQLLGPTYLANRFTAASFSLIMLAAMMAWTRHAFDAPTALLTGAGLAVSFWAVMSGRQALRSITLPALFVLAARLWISDLRLTIATASIRNPSASLRPQPKIINYILAGILLGATFYTYIPARILWLAFPLTVAYAAWQIRPFPQRIWQGTLLMLLIAGVLGSPLFWYLHNNPEAEVRIGQLSQPLTAVLDGEAAPLLTHIVGTLRLFTSQGDRFIRYNIPGQPWFSPLLGLFFYLGLLVTIRYILRPHDKWLAITSFFALTWFFLGLTPVLITGPELSTTQAIGAQPVLFLFPALGLLYLRSWIDDLRLENRQSFSFAHKVINRQSLWVMAALFLFAVSGIMTFHNYFTIWANDPAVRVQYESTMVAAMRYVNMNDWQDTAVSTITPDLFHTPALAQVTLRDTVVRPRWFDARGSLLFPQADNSTVLIPGFTPLHPTLISYFATANLIDTLPLRPSDLDRPLTVYTLEAHRWQADLANKMTTVDDVYVGDVLSLRGYDLLTPQVQPGQMVQLVTWWQVRQAIPWPQEAVLFTHLLGTDNVPIAQADRLDVPAHAWQAGDSFLQLHEFWLPHETAVGLYPLTIGLYTIPNNERQPIYQNNSLIGDAWSLPPLQVGGP